MAATLVGEAAIRIVPTLRGFKTEVERSLRSMEFSPVKVKIEPKFAEADAKMDEWRARQDLKHVNVNVRANGQQFDRDMKAIEHRVAQSPLKNLLHFNIKILGLDALPALGYAAASAASGLDALGESVLALPGLLGGALASVGALTLGMHGLKDAFTAYGTSAKDAAQHAHQIADDNRTLQHSYRDYRDAVRDTTREIQDLNAENRRSSLNIADAQLSVQEAADKLREGGFTSVTEMRRAQLGYAESLDHLQDVQTKATRTQEDANRANAQGVTQSDKVQNALAAIAKNTEKLDNDKIGEFGRALARLSPNAAAAVTAVTNLHGAYTQLQGTVQNHLFAGMDKDITNLAQVSLPMLTNGFARVADGLNTNFHQIFASLGQPGEQGLFARVFGNTTGGLSNLSKGIQPLIDGVSKLTAISSDFLPRLGVAADHVFNRFDTWIDKISADGSLKQWINQGLGAMDDLGRIATGVIGVVHSVGQAFDEVSGHQGGFLKTFADEMAKVEQHLNSPGGLGKLEGYLRGAKNEFGQIRSAWDTMKPTVEELVGFARDWSAQSLGLLGNVLKLVGAFDSATHAAGPLLTLFLYMKTAKQGFGLAQGIGHALLGPDRALQSTKAWWDRVSTAQATAGSTAVAAGAEIAAGAEVAEAASAKLGAETEATGKKLDTASMRAKAMTTNVTNFTSPARTAADGTETLGSNAERAGGQLGAAGESAQRSGSKISEAGKQAGEAAESVGGKGRSLLTAGKNLLGMIGPGLAMEVAVIGITTLIGKLGDAHRKAAEDADRQRAALDALKDSLDKVSGSVTGETQAQTAKAFQNYSIHGLGSRNILQDIATTGAATPQQLISATDPTQQDQRSDILNKLDAQTMQAIGQSDVWKRYASVWQSNGVDLLTLSQAADGDEAALAKVRAAEQKMFGDSKGREVFDPTGTFVKSRIGSYVAAPSLTDTLKSAGIPNSATSAIALRNVAGSNSAQGDANRQASNAVSQGKLNAQGLGQFPFGGMNVIINATDGTAQLEFDGPDNPQAWVKGFPSEDGSASVMTDGRRIQVRLSPDATARDIDKFASGGLVQGKGGPRDDQNIIAVSGGEHVAKAKAVDYYGVPFFDSLNNMQIPKSALAAGGWPAFAPGGWPPPHPPSPGIVTPGVLGGVSASANAPMGPNPPTPSFRGLSQPPDDFAGFAASHGGGKLPMGPQPKPSGPHPYTSLMGLGGSWGKSDLDKIEDAVAPPKTAPPKVTQSGGLHQVPGPDASGNVPLYFDPATGSTTPPVAPAGGPTPHLTGGSPGPVADLGGLGGGAPAIVPTVGAPGAPAGTPGVPDPAAPIYSSVPTPGGPVVGMSGPVANNMMSFAQSVAGRVPYKWGGFSPEGMDCSGLAAALANIATGQDPFAGGRFSTGNELEELTKRGFVAGPGGAGSLTIGWNSEHTGVTLPDGSHIDAEDEKDGIVLGGHSQGATGFPNVMHLPVSGDMDLGALTPGGVLPGGVPGSAMDGTAGLNPLSGLQNRLNPQNLLGNIKGHYAEALAPQNIMKFFMGQASSVGSGMMNIGTSFLSGITGLNLSAITGPATQLGNGLLGLAEPVSGGTPGSTALTDSSGALINQFMGGGVGGTGLSGGAFGNGKGGGGAAYSSLIGQVLQQYGPQFGIPPSAYPAWQAALIKQIDTESSGSTSVVSSQGDVGLLQFKPATFDEFNISGGSINDPKAQLIAALNRLTKGGANAYSMNADGSPAQIGQGVGWASGGSPAQGGAMVSKGEFITSPAATAYYGAQLFNGLNSMSVPRSVTTKLAGGGFLGDWPLQPPMPAPVPQTPRAPQPTPQGETPNGADSGHGETPQAAGIRTATSPTVRMGPAQPLAPKAPGAESAAPGSAPGLNPGRIGMGGESVASSDGASSKEDAEKRAGIGATGGAPSTNTHLNPAISQFTNGVAQGIGNVASMAASAGSMGMGGGAAGAAIGGAAQLGAEAINSGLNIAASFLTQNKGPANGSPLMAKRPQVSMDAPTQAQGQQMPDVPTNVQMQGSPITVVQPVMQQAAQGPQRVHNGDVHVTNLDEYKRTQETLDAQLQMPWVGKYG